MKNKKNNYLKKCLDITYFIVVAIFFSWISEKWHDLEFFVFCLNFLYLIIIYCLLGFFSCLWHELGHLIFGVRANLNFVSFNVLGIKFTKENNKLVLKKQKNFRGIGGYCELIAKVDEEYDQNKISEYFMGGIIFEFIAAIISLILLIIIKNSYLKYICIINIMILIYSILINLIPNVNSAGIITDMAHLLNNKKEKDYIKKISKIYEINNLINNGIQLKDIDGNLFSFPKEICNYTEVKYALVCIDYMGETEKYNEAIKCIKFMLEDKNNVLIESDIYTLKFQLLNALFYGKYDLNIINEYWDEKTKKNLDVLSNYHPYYLGLKYLYVLLIEKNSKAAKMCLKKFEKMKKNFEVKIIRETEKIINDVNDRKNLQKQ